MKKQIKYIALAVIAFGVATKVVLMNKKDKLKVTFKDGKLFNSNFNHKNLKINVDDLKISTEKAVRLAMQESTKSDRANFKMN